MLFRTASLRLAHAHERAAGSRSGRPWRATGVARPQQKNCDDLSAPTPPVRPWDMP